MQDGQCENGDADLPRWDYVFGPFRFVSDLEIPQLHGATGEGRIKAAILRSDVSADLPGAAILDRFCQVAPSAYLLDIPGVARYLVTNGSEVQVQVADGAPAADVCSYLLGSIFGALCHQNGLLPLHASAIQGASGVTAFLGNSGAGKSTLAACLQARGRHIVSDDICLLEDSPDGFKVVPVAGWVKLWRESLQHLGEEPEEQNRVFAADDKFRVFLSSGVVAHPRVRHVVVLERAEAAVVEPKLKPLTAVETIAAMMQLTYLAYVVQLTGKQAELFRKCARILTEASGYRLVVPWGWDNMDAVLDLIEQRLLS